MRKNYLLFILFFNFFYFSGNVIYAQSCACGGTVPTFNVNLTAATDTTWTLSSTTRAGLCCAASGSDKCIRFIVTVNPASDLVNFVVNNPSPPGGAFYQIDCGAPVSLGTPACILGMTSFCITYCKAGGDAPDYVITATRTVQASNDVIVREGCSSVLTVTGLQTASILWNAQTNPALYNTYLSCTAACASTTVTPPAGSAPATINYIVSGNPATSCPGVSRDTVQVTVVPGMTASISPAAPVICSGNNVTLTANPVGGSPPFTYLWNTGATTQSIVVNTAGTYSVAVSDQATGCGPINASVVVTASTIPADPTVGSNSPVCQGSTINLTSSSDPGSTYSWTGPNAFSSALQNPSIANGQPVNAGTYTVTANLGGCLSNPVNVVVAINPIPATPTPSSNSPICEGQTINLSTTAVVGATYSWTGPNGFTSSLQNPTIANGQAVNAGVYSLTVTVGGCTSVAGTTTVVVNPTPATPTASSSSPDCVGQTLSLTTPAVGGATYAWTGPNAFSSALQNPTIPNVQLVNAGVYSVTITVGGCTSAAGTTNVVINPIPATPSPSSNSPICAGSTINLSTAAVAGATYAWTGPNAFSSALQNPTIANGQAVNAGVYSLTTTVAGCTSAAGTTTVVVNPIPATPAPSSNSPICAGQTINLTTAAVGGATYAWTGPNAFSSALQNPTIANGQAVNAGVYSLTITVSGCTSAAGTTTVVVNPTPATPTASSSSPDCVGQTLSLTTPAVGGATYSWTGPNAFSSALQNPTIPNVQLVNAGVYSVTVTVAGCTSAAGTTTVVINPIPATPSPSSNSPICAGQTINLTTAAVGGATYAWTGPNSFSSALQNPTIANGQAVNAGVYSLTITVSGCASAAGTTTVVVNPTPAAPTASSSSPDCVGQTLSLTTPAVGGATYAWTGPNAFSSALQNPTIPNVQLVNAGVYSVTITVGGCTSAAGTTNVVINPIPATPSPSSNSPICAGSTINLSTAAVAGATYAWTGPNAFSSALQNPTIANGQAVNAGVYSLTTTVAGCTSAAGTTTVVVNPIPAMPAPSSNSPICAGQTINLTTAAVGGATYAWTGPNAFSSALQNPTIANGQAVNAGVYSLTITVSGCTSAAGTTTVVVNPIPATPTASSSSPDCEGQTLSLTTPAVGGATYSWSGPNAFSSALQNPTIPNAQAVNAGVYSVTVTVSGCTSAAGTTTVVINTTPATPVISSNTPVCSGQSINLTSNLIPGVTYAWTGPNGFTSTLQNPTIANAQAVNAGVYTLVVDNGCASAPATTTVVVNPTPATPTASSSSPDCVGQTLSLTTPAVGGATYAWTGPNAFSSALQNPTIPNVQLVNAGVYSVTITVGGCTSAAGTTNVVINPIPATPSPSSNSPICAGTTLNLTTSAVAGATYSWTGPPAFTSSVQNPNRPNATVAMSGVYSLTVTVAGCTSAAGTTNVTVNPIPAAPTASSNSPVCENATLNLTASNIAGATYSWTGPSGFTSTSQNPSIPNVLATNAGVYSVTAIVSGCSSTAATTTVVVNPTPATPTATSNSPLCVGGTIDLSTTAVAGATYSWTGPNGFSSTLQNPSISNATTAEAGVYSLAITVAGCTSAAGTTTVVVNTAPSTPTAGSNSPICSGQNLDLTCNLIAGATYSWTGPNGFTSTLQNPTITNAQAVNAGTYTVIANNGCASSPATTVVVVNATPATPTASSSSPDCVGQTLSLTTPLVGGATYAWSGPGGYTSALQNPTIPNVQLTDAGTYSVTVTVGGCTSTAGSAVVVINPIPATPSPSSNSPICAGTTLNLTTSAVAGATYSWTGPPAFSSSSQNPNRPNATVAMSGVYSLTVTVAGCTSAAGTTNVTVNPKPATPTASSNSPLCSGQTLNLNATTVGGSTYAWTGPNGFTSATQNPSLTNVTTADAGIFSVIATENGCSSNAGTTTVVINPIPATPSPSSNSPLCIGQNIDLTTTAVVGATYAWSGPNGYTSALQNPTITNATASESGVYSLTITVAGCTSAAGTTTVTVNSAPVTPTAGSNTPVCEGQNIDLTCSLVAGATYSWSGPNGFTSTLQNPTVTNAQAVNAGVYTVIADNGCASSPATTTVVVNTTPAAPTASSSSPDCEGQTLSLTTPFVGGATYSWSGPNGFTSILQNPTITNVQLTDAGVYSVTITVNGCTSAAGTTNVVINPIPATPTANSNSPICETQTLVLITPSVGGATYSWTGPGGYSSSSQNPSRPNATLAMAGNYSITVTVAGCTSAAGTTSVTILPTPAAPTVSNNGPLCEGDDLDLTSNTVAGATYNWTGPNGFTSSLEDPTLTNVTSADAGVFSLTVTSGGCTSVPSTTTVVINPIPAAPITSSNSPICVGQNLDLTSNLIGGATYSWTGPNGFTSSLQNPSITNATTAATGNYDLTVTVNGCTSTVTTLSASVNSAPVLPVASSNSPVCEGYDLDLFVDTIPGATYSWTGPNGFTSTQQNPTITGATAAAAGSYTVIADNGCASNPATTTVVINPTPAIPNATSSSPDCEGSTLSLTSNLVAGAIYSWTGPNGFTASTQNTSIPNITSVNAGMYYLTVTVNGCTSLPDSVLSVISQPAITDAGSNQTVCANNNAVVLSGSVTGGSTTGIWSTSGSGTFTPSATNLGATYNPSAADTTAGSIILTLTSTNTPGCAADLATITITITDSPLADAGIDQSVCSNNAIATLGGFISDATGGIWTTTGTGTFSNDTDLNATYTASSADTSAGSVSLILNSTGNGTCLGDADTMVLTFTVSPFVNAGTDQFVCLSSPNASLNGIVSGATTTGTWTTSGTGTFNPNANSLTATYIPSNADTTAGMVTLVLTSTINGGCTAVDDTMNITYTTVPVVDAGIDQTVCGNNAVANLSGIVIGGGGNGLWTTSGTGTFSPLDTDLNATYTPSAADTTAGTVTLTLTSTTGCAVDSDQMTLTITDAPNANAGVDIFVCQNNSDAALNGIVSGATTTGDWSTSGTGTFSSGASSLSNTYVASASDISNGSATVFLTSTNNGGCVADVDTLLITYTPPPTAFAGNDTSICANSPMPLNGIVLGGVGTGAWTTSGTGIFSPNANTLNAMYIASTADTTSGTVTLTLTTTNNGGCIPSVDQLILTLTDAPTVNAGADQNLCSNNSLVTLNGIITDAGGGMWTSTGAGTFADPFATGTTYTPDATEISGGSTTLILTSTGNGTCSPVSDTILINFFAAPIVDAGADIFVCTGSMTANLNGNVSGITTTGDWSTLGTGTFSPSSSSLNGTYDLSVGDTTAGTVILVLTSTNNNGCLAITDTVFVTLTTIPTVIAGNDTTACGNNSNITLNGTVNGGGGTGIWTTSGTGFFTPDSVTLNATYIPSSADTTAGSVTLTLTATNSCVLVNDSLVINYTTSPFVDAGADQSFCSQNVVPLNGVINSVPLGALWSTNGSGTFNSGTTTLINTYTLSPSDTTLSPLQFYLTTFGSGTCFEITDTMNVFFSGFPNAEFIVNNACENQNVLFNDTSTVSPGTITSWMWDFGNGDTSSVEDPTETFVSSGDFTVTLIVQTSGGCADTVSHDIHINATPNADFSFIDGCVNDILFTDNSSISTGTITTYDWDFGDGNTSAIPSPNNIYADTGSYSVSLTVTSDSLCSNTITQTVIILPQPIAGFTMNAICGTTTVNFADTSIVMNDSIVNYQWIFTNGTGADTSNVSNDFGVFGIADATLIVTTLSGCTDTASITFTLNDNPIASFVPNDSTFFTDEVVDFYGDPDNMASYDWDFGDSLGTSSLQDTSYMYITAGTYTVILTVTDSLGCNDTASHTYTIIDDSDSTGNVGVPGAFTPNGDGINDVLYVRGGPLTELSFTIFNEWGNQIFFTDDQSVGWDGKYKRKDQPGGVYVYILKAVSVTGEEIDTTGHFIIIK